MTTVTYKAGIIACDNQALENDIAIKCSVKAVQNDTHVFCLAGTLTTGLNYLAWLQDAGPDSDVPPPKQKGTDVVQFCKKTGKVGQWYGNIYLPIEDRIAAWGSGAHLALGAMAAGASAEEAIKIASKWDPYSGLGVQVFKSKKAR